MIKLFDQDNVIYLELRSTPRATDSMTKLKYIEVICETISNVWGEESDIVVKYLPSIDRAQSAQANEETLDAVLELIKSPDYRDFIVGIDFSGNPSVGNFADFKPLLQRARHSGLKLAIHCAEIAGRAEESKEMLESGLVDRIGHGTFLDGELI